MIDNMVYDASLDAEMEERSKVDLVRDDSESIKVGDKLIGKIKSYKYKVLVRNKPDVEGEFSREQMDLIYRLYSAEGSNLQQRHVSRYFPDITFSDFKRILRAFNITKSSSPLAPHVIEEKSLDELVELTMNSKEVDYLRKLEQDRVRLTEVKLKEMTKKYFELKNSISDFSEFLSGVDFKIEPIKVSVNKTSKDNTIIIYLSDMHIGADVSSYSIYDNQFDFDVAKQRLNDLVYEVISISKNSNINSVYVCNLGDSLDGYNAETTRGGHKLPQNMNNKDQYKNYIKLMLDFFATLSSSSQFNEIKYYCVEGGNHDGDFGFMVNKSLEACLSILNPNIETVIFEKFIDSFTIEDHSFLLCHGKDAKDMFRNMPLVINDKIENQINEYLDYYSIDSNNIHFIKGDLHQSATTYGKRFRYKSVGSFFGSSEWIHKNFGNTKPIIDYDLLINNKIYEGRLVL